MCASGRFDVVNVVDPVFHEDAFVLHDHAVGSSALVIPGLGNNLMSFSARLPNAEPLEVILGAPVGTTAENAWRWGNPILFPFPNRVRNGRYTFAGRKYQLDVNIPEGHHLHGLVCYLPWKVDYTAEGVQGAAIRSSISAEDHPDVMRQFPFPFRLTVTYTLQGNSLRCEVEVTNVGSGPLPMGFGLHPYFRVPLGPGGTREQCLLQAPASRIWQLSPDKLPTGNQEPVPPELDFRQPRPLDGTYLDHCYTGLLRGENDLACRLIDPHPGLEVVEEFGPEFPELVLLAPSDRSTVSFEPYTCVTDAINLADDRQDTGLIVLQSGQTWRGEVAFSVSALTDS